MNTTASAIRRSMGIPDPRIPVKLAGLDEDSMGTAQESIPVPYVAGENIVAARWLSPIYNQYATIAPEEDQRKK